jgi:phosphate transport system protein
VTTHFIDLIEQLQRRCIRMAGMAQQAVTLAAQAVKTLDPAVVEKVFEGEKLIDAEEVEIERQAINLLLLHHPAATDFRTVFGVVKINSDLERIGDCAVNIAQQVGGLLRAGLEEGVPRDVRSIADAALMQVEDMVRCIAMRNSMLADRIRKADDLVDALNGQILQETQARMQQEPTVVPAGLALIMIAKNFERIGDHCVNIAEDVVFLMCGHIIRHEHEQR